MKDFKMAFTLAEVLITLVIVGVVAAMTLPTLINKINDKVNVNKLKREYSVLQQAFQQIVAENDYEFKNALSSCIKVYAGTGNTCLKDVFKQKLKYVSDCDLNNRDNLGKCFVADKDVKYYNGEALVLNGAGYFNSNLTAGLLLNSGASISFFLDSNECAFSDGAAKRCGWFMLDVNGPKRKPNTIGKDLFLFYLESDKIVPSYFQYYGTEDCGEGTNYGYTCAGKLLLK